MKIFRATKFIHSDDLQMLEQLIEKKDAEMLAMDYEHICLEYYPASWEGGEHIAVVTYSKEGMEP